MVSDGAASFLKPPMTKRKVKKKTIKLFDPEKWIDKQMRRALSRMWLFWPPRKLFKDSKEESDGLYPCDNCGNRFERNAVAVDHIRPAVPVNEVQATWDAKIKSRLCFEENFQLLCSQCHLQKSKIENAVRREFKKKTNV